MENTEFDQVQYSRLLANGYKFIELEATGKDIETDEDSYKKEINLIAHKEKPNQTDRYILEIADPEILEMLKGSDTDVFYLKLN